MSKKSKSVKLATPKPVDAAKLEEVYSVDSWRHNVLLTNGKGRFFLGQKSSGKIVDVHPVKNSKAAQWYWLVSEYGDSWSGDVAPLVKALARI